MNGQRTGRLTSWLSMAALPLVSALTAAFALAKLPPMWRLYPDPAYQYLVNGLSVTVGSGPGHTDHPGTSLQWLVGLVNLAFHSISTIGVPLIQDVTTRPETYMLVNAALLVALQAVALWFLGVRLQTRFGTGAALLAQAAIVGTAAMIPWRLYVIPETLVIVCGVLLLGLVAPKLAAPGGVTGWRTWLALGFIMAVGLTSKVIFIPMLLLPLFLYNWRALLRIFATFALSTVAIMWVTRDQLQRMWDWYTAVAKTSARYPDEVVTRSLTDGLRDIPVATIQNYPVVLLALVIVIVGLIARFRRREQRPPVTPTIRVLVALIVAMLGTLAMTYKAYRVNDLLLLAPLAGVVIAIGWGYIRESWTTSTGHKVLIGVPVLAAMLAAVLGFTSASSFVDNAARGTDTTRMVEYLDEQVAQGTTVATGYGVFSQASALYFANQSARYVSLSELLSTHPRWIDYSIWNGLFYTFNTTDGKRLATCQELTDIVNAPGGLLVAPGRPFAPDTSGLQSLTLRYQPEQVFGSQIVYRIQSVTCP